MTYRPETLKEFINKEGQMPLLKGTWVGVIALCIVLKIALHLPWTIIGVPLLMFAILIPLILYISVGNKYKNYTAGRNVFQSLPQQDVTILQNVELFIKAFDVMSKTGAPRADMYGVVYQYQKADLLLTPRSIILLGIAEIAGVTRYAAPVEIVVTQQQTSAYTATLLGWAEAGGRLMIQIQDESFSRPLKIEFKDHLEEIGGVLRDYI